MRHRVSAADEGVFPRLSALIIVWLTAKRKSHPLRELDEQLYRFAANRLSRSEWKLARDRTVTQLEARGWVSRPSPRTLALTKQGRKAAFAELGSELPRDGVPWRTLAARWLAVRAMQPQGRLPREAPGRLDNKRFIAEVIRDACGVPVSPFSPRSKVLDVFFWRQLGEERSSAFTLASVKKLLLQRLLGSARDAKVDQLLRQVAVRALAAPTASALRTAVIRRWLEARDTVPPSAAAPPPRAPTPTSPSPTSPAPAGTLETLSEDAFARLVGEAARSAKTGRFGDRKVFVSHVYRRLAEMGHVGTGIELFKERLLRAHRAQRLVLSPADLVQAMPAADVSESAIHHSRSTYHFVETDAPSTPLRRKVS